MQRACINPRPTDIVAMRTTDKRPRGTCFRLWDFIPCVQATDEYVLGAPLFTGVVLKLENGKEVVIRAEVDEHGGRIPGDNRYIQSMTVNGSTYTKNYLKHSELMEGMRIELLMGTKPDRQRGTQKTDAPYSFSNEE